VNLTATLRRNNRKFIVHEKIVLQRQKQKTHLPMKTAIFSGIKPVTAWARIALQCTVVIATLSAGNLFAAPVVKTLGGGATSGYFGYKDTNTLYALFHTPMGVAVSQDGQTVFLADRDNNAVRLLTDFGSANNGYTFTFTTNFLSKPVGVAVDIAGDVFVLNRGSTNNNTATNGTVLEFDTYGFFVATNASHLTNAQGIALDTYGNLYVTERSNLLVMITNSVMTTVATVTNPGASLQGVAYMPNGSLAVCDSGRNGIYSINPNTGIITTNAGFNGQGDGTGINNNGLPTWAAKFFQPMGVAAAGDGSLIVSDFGNARVKVITSSGIVTNFYGVSSNDWVSPYPGWVDGTVAVPDQSGGVASRCPQGVALSPDGTTVYTTEDFYHLIRKVTGQSFAPPPQPIPSAPTGLTATLATNQQSFEVILTWDPQNNATNFIVGRATSSGGPYTAIANTPGTTYTDTGVIVGQIYYYVLQAENSGGISPTSQEVSIAIPVPPPNAPTIGWYDFEPNTINGVEGFYSVLHPVTAGNPYVANNPLNIAIDPGTNGLATKFITSPPYTNNVPISTIANFGSTAPQYENQTLPGPLVNSLPTLQLSNGVVTVQSVNVNGLQEASAASSATFIFQVGTPSVLGNNAAQFTLSDVTTNVIFYYTLDGSDPTNAPISQQVPTTNGTVTLSLNGSSNILFQVRAIGTGPDAAFQISGIAQQDFSPNTYVPNTISWGFSQGECSSAFLGAAGQTFYAPVTLTMLPGTPVYSLQFNLVVTNGGPGVTNAGPPVAPGAFDFESMLMKPFGQTQPPTYTNIPPLMFAGYITTYVPPQDYVLYDGFTNFVSLEFTNDSENLLGVGWLERVGQTNLYNTESQTLITFSIARDDLFPNTNQPTGVIVGGYGFQIPANAAPGDQYQIRIGSPSATDNGIGNPGSSVTIVNPFNTNALALGPGTLNAIKNVTVASIPYLVGDVYNFRWFNAGDFGTGNLSANGSANAAQVFEDAIYDLGVVPTNSDFFDAMDSCGSLGVYDGNASDEFYGYYTNAGTASGNIVTNLFNGGTNLTNMDQIAFGDGILDICDVYVTYVRSLDPQRTWFERIWTNGVLVATTTPNLATAVAMPSLSTPTSGKTGINKGAIASQSAPTSITNTPLVNFTAGDYQASPGQTITIPVNANTFGPYPLRMLMLNLNVVPLDGSPALTVPVQFAPNPALSSAIGGSTPAFSLQRGNGNYSGAWLPSGTTAPSELPGLTGNANIGYLTVTIPATANSMSAYAISFGHASGSPSGLASFPKKAFTGLITLSSRTNSYYNDGIPDSWRLRYFGTIYNELSVSNADADGTGMNNYQKYVAGLNPEDSTSVLNEGVDQPMANSQQDFVLYWPSVAGQTYIIKRSPTLFPPQWTAISTNIGDGTYMEIHDTSGGNNRYYEVTTP
jgi:hypothetical protein